MGGSYIELLIEQALCKRDFIQIDNHICEQEYEYIQQSHIDDIAIA